MYAVWSGDDAEADDRGDAEADDRGDADELNLAMSVGTDHARAVTATRATKPKQASTRAFRTHGGLLGSGRWPAG